MAPVIAILIIVAMHAAVVWLWFWPPARWEALRQRLEKGYSQRFLAFVKASPALLLSCWLVIAIFSLAGNLLNQVGNIGVLLGLTPFLLFFTAMMFSWPLWIIPPGARDAEAIGEARFVRRHPLWAAMIILGLIAVGFLLGRLRYG